MRLPLIILLILLTPLIVQADTTYPYFGGTGQDYSSSSTSIMNSENDNINIADSYPLTDAQGLPLIDDLDGDGNNEIVVFSGNTLGIYKATMVSGEPQLSALSGYSTNNTNTGLFYSNMIIYDWDSDGYKEVLFASVYSGNLYAIQWNGSHATNEGFTLDSSGITWVGGADIDKASDIVIGCGDPDGCIAIYNTRNAQLGVGTIYLYASPFDSTQSYASTRRITLTSVGVGNAICLSLYKSVPYSTENGAYYNTFGRTGSITSLDSITINSTQHITYTRVTNGNQDYMPATDCGRGVTYFTSPTISEFKEDNVGDEISYGYQYNIDEFKLVVYDKALTEINAYPIANQADGRLKSGVMVMKAFIDSEDDSSLCVLGQNKEISPYGRLDLLCADIQSPVYAGAFNNVQFIYNFNESPDYNVTSYFNDYSMIYSSSAHAINTLQNGLDEVMCSYGVLKLEDRSQAELPLGIACKSLYTCALTFDYETPFDVQSSIIPIDYFDIEKDDFIGIKSNQLYYLDDGFVNQNAYLGDCTRIRPSPNAIWQIHEEPVFSSVTYFPNQATILNGTLITGSVASVASLDTVYYRVREVLSDGSYVHNVDYSFIEACDGDTNRIFIHQKTTEDPNDDDSYYYIWNYQSGTWDYVSFKSFDGDTWMNHTITLPTNLSNYLSGGGNLKLKHTDTFGVSDITTADNVSVDYMALQCNGTFSSGKTNAVKVTVKPIDPEDNDVSGSAYLYYGETNQQFTGWSANWSSTTEIPLPDLYPNETTSSSKLRICVRDSKNYFNEPYCEEWEFIVQSTGDVYTDSDICVGITPEEYEENTTTTLCDDDDDCDSGEVCNSEGVCEEIPPDCTKDNDCPQGYSCISNECEILPSPEDNSITSAVNVLAKLSGVPILVLVFIIFVFVAYEIFTTDFLPQSAKLPATGLMLFGLLVLFTILGLIPVVWLILLIIVSLGSIGIAFASYMKGRD